MNFPVDMEREVNQELLHFIAQRIKALRTEKGLTQENFYNDTNIHIGRIELAKRDISVSTISKICDYFEISISTFFEDFK
jgi:transcriptional regulator with XRE-family HTH domain